MSPDVIVVGGGCAGLAAATDLAERGAAVLLLEARRRFGGRSRSWQDPVSGDIEDNGQHLVMGCYEQFLAFVRRTGGAEQLKFQQRFGVVMLEPDGRTGSFAPGRLPGPFDLLWGLLRLRGFPLRDALGAGGLMRELRRDTGLPADLTASDWLRSGGQSDEARRRFWEPLILATLNLPGDRAPANLLAAVLRQALLGGSDASRLGFATRGLSGLIVTPSLAYLRRSGSAVRSGAPVRRLERDGRGRCVGVRMRDGELQSAGAVILAVPHREAAELLDGLGGDFDRAAAERLGASPIVAVHLWLDREVSPHLLAALIDSPIHWVFDRGRIGGAGGPGYLALVTSAADGLVGMDPPSLQRLALDEVRRHFPAARDARLLRARVLKERRATPALDANSPPFRPGACSGTAGLYLAGDWTATGLPATLEGAAASGHRAAELASEGVG